MISLEQSEVRAGRQHMILQASRRADFADNCGIDQPLIHAIFSRLYGEYGLTLDWSGVVVPDSAGPRFGMNIQNLKPRR